MRRVAGAPASGRLGGLAGGSLHAPDLAQLILQAELVEGAERQGREYGNALMQHPVRNALERTVRHGQPSRRATGGATGRRILRRGLQNAARLRVCDARVLFDAYAVVGAFAGREKRLPRDAGRIVDPGLFGLRVAAGRLSLLDENPAGLAKPRIDVAQLAFGFDLDAEMIEARLLAARRDRKIDAR